MGTRKRRPWLALALALCLAITMIPQNIWRVQAAGNANNAEVLKVWATINRDGMPENLEIADAKPSGKELVAIYVENGSYTVTNEQYVMFLLNNATVIDTAYSIDDTTNIARLAGDSSYELKDWTASSTQDRFPAYEGEKTIEAVEAFFTSGSYAEDPENDIWPEPYDFTLKQDYTLNQIFTANQLTIPQGTTLTLGSFLEEGESRKAGSVLQANKIVVSGTLNMLKAEDEEKPTGVTIFQKGTFQVTNTGKVNGNDGSLIVLFRHADISGLDLYAEVLDNGQAVLKPFSFAGSDRNEQIHYDGEAKKWVFEKRDDVSAGDNKLLVRYDMFEWGENDDRAFVTVNGERLNNKETIDFTVGQEFTVVLDPPLEREACKPIVFVETGDGKFYASNETGERALTITNNTFTLKATSEAGITIRVNWSDYDMFGPSLNEFMIEADGYGATITVDGENVKSMTDPYDEKVTRYIFQRDMFKDEKTVSITFKADEGNSFDRITYWDGKKNTYFVMGLPRSVEEKSIWAEDSGFTEKGGIYTFTYTEAPQAESVSFFTVCNPGDQTRGITIDSTDYQVEYCIDDDTQFKPVNESRLIGYDVYRKADKVTLKVNALPGADPVKGISVIWYTDGKYCQEYLPLTDGKLVLEKTGQYWSDDYTIQILDWEPAFNGQYSITAYLQEGDEIELIGKEFDKKYTFEPGEKISFTLKGKVYKVYAEYSFADNIEIIPVGDAYSFTPESDKGFQIVVYPSKECYDYHHMNDDYNKGEMFGEIHIVNGDKDLVGGTFTMNIEPTYQVIWGDQIRFATDGKEETLEYTIIPRRCSDYAVWMEDQDVTEAVKANNNVLKVETTNEFNYKRVEIFFLEGKSTPVTDVFDDIPENAWYKKAVQFVYDREIMNGKGKSVDGTKQIFGPNQQITRGEFATLLYNREKKPEVEFELTFKDVKASAYFVKPIKWLCSNKIAKGYNETKFGPNDAITREQIAQMLYEYAKLKGYDVTIADDVTLERFADAKKVSSWAETAMKWATSKGIINGTGDETPKINPKGKTTRAECAAMIKNLEEKVVNLPQE